MVVKHRKAAGGKDLNQETGQAHQEGDLSSREGFYSSDMRNSVLAFLR